MADLFSIGVSGLKAHQAALAVTGQNITNAGTPGYTRQRVDMEPQISGTQGGSFQGSGVRVDRIARIADEYLTNQVRIDTALFSELDTFSAQINQIEGVLFSDSGGLDGALQSFFGALQLASNDPADMANRRMVLGEARNLSDRFQTLYGRLTQQRDDVASVLRTGMARANELAEGIAELNHRIAGALTDQENGSVNALLDRRDEMLRELATFIKVSTIEQSDGQLNVFVGKGQALVLGTEAAQLELTAQGQVAMRADDRSERQLVTAALTGGEIGGALRFRESVLNPAINQLGRIALAVTAQVNEVHAGGIDLNGDPGGLLFADLNEPQYARLRAVADEGNRGLPGAISVTVDDPLQVPVSDYQVTFDESGNGVFSVRRAIDGETVFQGRLTGDLPQTVQFDHLSVTFESGAFQGGDVYHVQPLRTAAGVFGAALGDPALLALAGPIAVQAAFGNQSDATVTTGDVFDPGHPVFSADGRLSPLVVRFTSPTSYEILDNTDPANPVPLDPPLANLPYSPGQTSSLLPGAGTRLVLFDGPATARLPGAGSVVTGLAVGSNGYPSQIFDLTQVDPATGSVIGQQSISVSPDSSARQIAAALSTLAGVSARAETEVTLSGLVDNGVGTPLSVAINGVDLGPVSSLNELADAINDNFSLSDAGVVATSDGTRLRLQSVVGDDLTVQVAGDPTDSVVLESPSGGSLTLAGAGAGGDYRSATIGGQVTALLQPDVTLSSPASGVMAGNPAHRRADLGFELFMTGSPAAGDTYELNHNTSGIGDNRNGLRLANLLTEAVLGDPPLSFTETYGELVQFVGVQSSQSQVNRDAARSLLEQSTARRESVSGVNLDEEAANLIRFEQAYNASAQIISVARETFNTLFTAVQ